MFLVSESLAIDQNFAVLKQLPGRGSSVQYADAPNYSSMLKKIPYIELYEEQAADRLYNFRMIDGALVQMSYEFNGRQQLVRHRLAYWPSPLLLQFQESPETYLEGEIYGDVVDYREIVVPIRFDYDNRDGVAKDMDHPVSHLTLGRYKHCRIASTSAISPYLFMEFLLRGFYNTPDDYVSKRLPVKLDSWPSSITAAERQRIHVGVPCS